MLDERNKFLTRIFKTETKLANILVSHRLDKDQILGATRLSHELLLRKHMMTISSRDSKEEDLKGNYHWRPMPKSGKEMGSYLSHSLLDFMMNFQEAETN